MDHVRKIPFLGEDLTHFSACTNRIPTTKPGTESLKIVFFKH